MVLELFKLKKTCSNLNSDSERLCLGLTILHTLISVVKLPITFLFDLVFFFRLGKWVARLERRLGTWQAMQQQLESCSIEIIITSCNTKVVEDKARGDCASNATTTRTWNIKIIITSCNRKIQIKSDIQWNRREIDCKWVGRRSAKATDTHERCSTLKSPFYSKKITKRYLHFCQHCSVLS